MPRPARESFLLEFRAYNGLYDGSGTDAVGELVVPITFTGAVLATPEPGVLALMLSGGLGLGFGRRAARG